MVLIYGESGRNSVRATQLYAERHPGRRYPSRATVDKLVSLFCEIGNTQTAQVCSMNIQRITSGNI